MSSINNRNPPVLPPQAPLLPDASEQVARNTSTTLKPSNKSIEQQQADRPVEVPVRKTSAADAERVFSQSGFARVGKKRRGGMEVEDELQGGVSLPVEDVDEKNWDQPTLDDAQEELTLHASQFKQLAAELAAEGGAPASAFEKLLSRSFPADAEGIAKLEGLRDAPAAAPASLTDLHNSMQAHFGLDIHAVGAGQAMVAAALVVAGHSNAILPEGEGLEPGRLTRGIQRVVEDSNSAVEDARTMSSGINKQLALHRTFVFKR